VPVEREVADSEADQVQEFVSGDAVEIELQERGGAGGEIPVRGGIEGEVRCR
jgi:hypothetical protein